MKGNRGQAQQGRHGWLLLVVLLSVATSFVTTSLFNRGDLSNTILDMQTSSLVTPAGGNRQQERRDADSLHQYETPNDCPTIESLTKKFLHAPFPLSYMHLVPIKGVVSDWLFAVPESENGLQIPGGEWYHAARKSHKFPSQSDAETIMKHYGDENGRCKSGVAWINAGAHMGMYGGFAASHGCRVVTIEAMDFTYQFHQTTRIMNGFCNLWTTLYNAVGDADDKKIRISNSGYGVGNGHNQGEDGSDLQMVTLTKVYKDYLEAEATKLIVVVDVEGFEQEVLQGAKVLLEKRVIGMLLIEVWLVQAQTTKPLHGLDLLLQNKYHLCFKEQEYKTAEELRTAILAGGYCGENTKELCVVDIEAYNSEWFKGCFSMG